MVVGRVGAAPEAEPARRRGPNRAPQAIGDGTGAGRAIGLAQVISNGKQGRVS
jgi:hypothetical protein